MGRDHDRYLLSASPASLDPLLPTRSHRPRLVEQVCADAIAGASSSGNLNSVSLVLTRDPERKQRLYELHFGQPMVLQAPLLITFCADWYRTRQWLRLRGARDNFNNLIGYHVAAFDAMILAQNVCLGFEAQGLGICYMGTTLHSMGEIADYLELPDTCLPVTTIVVGYPEKTRQSGTACPWPRFCMRRPTDAQRIRTWRRSTESARFGDGSGTCPTRR